MENDKIAMELKQLEKQVSEVDIKVSGILSYLRGNELNKDDKGLIGDVIDQDKRLVLIEYSCASHEKRVSFLESENTDKAKRIIVLEKWRDRAIWMGIGMALPAGVGIWEILSKFLNK